MIMPRTNILSLVFILVISNSILLPQSTKAQKWIDVSLKGSYYNSLFTNLNINRDPKAQFVGSYGYNTGVGLRYDRNKNYDLNTEITIDNYHQLFAYRDEGNTWKLSLEIISLGINCIFRQSHPIKARTYSLSEFYVEGGPKMNFIRNVRQYKLSPSSDVSTKGNPFDDISSHFKKNYLSFILGAGLKYDLTDKVYLNLGYRLNYGSSDDVVNTTGHATNRVYRRYLNVRLTRIVTTGIYLNVQYKLIVSHKKHNLITSRLKQLLRKHTLI